jgi:hypothetical protein
VRKVFCIFFIKIAVSACQYYEKFFCVAQFRPWGAASSAQFWRWCQKMVIGEEGEIWTKGNEGREG